MARRLSTLPAKISAGLLGAGLLLGGLGVAGALPGSVLTSHHDDEKVTTTDQPKADAPEAPDVDKPDATGTEPGEAAGEQKPATPADPSSVAVPTSVDEAAQIHAFDEACGNHGAYVSYFAQHGTEPQCAIDARSGAASTRPDDHPAADAAGDSSSHEPSARSHASDAAGDTTDGGAQTTSDGSHSEVGAPGTGPADAGVAPSATSHDSEHGGHGSTDRTDPAGSNDAPKASR